MNRYKRICLFAGGDDGGRRSPCAASQEIQLTKNGAPTYPTRSVCATTRIANKRAIT